MNERIQGKCKTIIFLDEIDDVLVKKIQDCVVAAPDNEDLSSLLDLIIFIKSLNVKECPMQKKAERILSMFNQKTFVDAVVGAIKASQKKSVLIDLLSLIITPDTIDVLLNMDIFSKVEVQLASANLILEAIHIDGDGSLTKFHSVVSKACPLVRLVWGLYSGSIGDERYLSVCQEAIDESALSHLSNLLSRPILSKNIYRALTLFIDLFDLSTFGNIDVFANCFTECLKRFPKLKQRFIREEETVAFLKCSIRVFPVYTEGSLKLMTELCASEEGCQLIDKIFGELVYFGADLELSDPYFVKEVDAINESKMRVADRDFEIVVNGVSVIIPKCSPCSIVSGNICQWSLRYSGWDLISRMFTANLNNPTLCCNILCLFECILKIQPKLFASIDGYMAKISSVFLDCCGIPLYKRLCSAICDVDIAPSLAKKCLDCLALIHEQVKPLDNADELARVALQFAEKLAKDVDMNPEMAEYSIGALLFASKLGHHDTDDVILKAVTGIADPISLCKILEELYSADVGARSMDKLLVVLNSNDIMDTLHLLENLSTNPSACIMITDIVKLNVNEWLYRSLSCEMGFISLLNFLSNWLSNTLQTISIPNSMISLLRVKFEMMENDTVTTFLLSLSHVNLPVLGKLLASEELTNKVKLRIENSNVSGHLFMKHCLFLVKTSDKFIGFSKLFVSSVKNMIDLIVDVLKNAIEKCDSETLFAALNLVSRIMIQKHPDMMASYTVSCLESKSVLEKLVQLVHSIETPHGNLDIFGDFIAVSFSSSTKLADLFAQTIVNSASSHSFSVEVLTALANAASLLPQSSPQYPFLISAIYERFDSISSIGTGFLDNPVKLHSWQNFATLTATLQLGPEPNNGRSILIKMLCSILSLNPKKHLPNSMLLLSCLISSSETNRATMQYLNFYNVLEHLVPHLLRTGQNHLQFVLLNQQFSEQFAVYGGVEGICDQLTNSPSDDHLWIAIILLSKHEKLRELLMYHFPVAKLSHIHAIVDNLLKFESLMLPRGLLDVSDEYIIKLMDLLAGVCRMCDSTEHFTLAICSMDYLLVMVPECKTNLLELLRSRCNLILPDLESAEIRFSDTSVSYYLTSLRELLQ